MFFFAGRGKERGPGLVLVRKRMGQALPSRMFFPLLYPLLGSLRFAYFSPFPLSGGLWDGGD